MWDTLAQFDYLRFPGRAGELQRSGDTDGFVVELGGNYDTYHGYLAQTLAALVQPHGRGPEPDDFEHVEDYFQACATLQEIISAEQLLRYARDVAAGRGANDAEPSDDETPVIDADSRLVAG